MTLYSIVPPEIVFKVEDGFDTVKFYEARYRGERIIVAQDMEGKCSISRLLSSCPRSFLDPLLQPGCVVDPKDLEKIN